MEERKMIMKLLMEGATLEISDEKKQIYKAKFGINLFDDSTGANGTNDTTDTNSNLRWEIIGESYGKIPTKMFLPELNEKLLNSSAIQTRGDDIWCIWCRRVFNGSYDGYTSYHNSELWHITPSRWEKVEVQDIELDGFCPLKDIAKQREILLRSYNKNLSYFNDAQKYFIHSAIKKGESDTSCISHAYFTIPYVLSTIILQYLEDFTKTWKYNVHYSVFQPTNNIVIYREKDISFYPSEVE